MKAVKKWYRELTFRRKVWFSFLSVSLIPVMVLGTFTYFQTRQLLIQREEKVVRETLKQSVISLNAALEICENAMENMVWDAMIKQTLERKYKNNYEMYLAYRDVVDPVILRIRNLNPQVKRITIYSSNETLYSHGDNMRKIERLEKLPEGIEDYKIHWETEENRRLEMYCGIYTKSESDRNVVYLDVDYDRVFGYLSGLFQEDYGVLVADELGNSVFSCWKFRDEAAGYGLTADEILEEKSSLGRYVIYEESIPANGWKIWLYRPLKVVSASAWSITALVFMVILLCVGIILTASYALTDSVVRPLKELIRNMDQIKEGHLMVDIQGDDKDEIGRLILRFSDLMSRLDCMVNEVYKSKILQQQYELRALQAQINPHFFYNSLSLINWKAIMAGQEEISEMSQLLSTFYRTTLNKGKNITRVKSEWDNTCSYARIQNLLHSGRLSLKMELEPGIEEYEILNLLLQPLVENAIVHGLDHKTDGGEKILEVSGREEEGRLVFVVRDNGCGIQEEELDGILTAESKGYGVQNVHNRIQLYYGTDYGLAFESCQGGELSGTKVTVRIPKKRMEDDTVQETKEETARRMEENTVQRIEENTR